MLRERRIRRYLLGELTPRQRARMDQQVLEREELYESVRAIEQDLIADYLADRLRPALRRSFESHFMNAPERRRRIDIARAVDEVVNRRSPNNADAGVYAVAANRWHALGGWRAAVGSVMATSVVAALIATWLLTQRSAPPVVLFPGVTRGADSGPVEIGSEQSTLTVALVLADGIGASRYDVVLERSSGTQVWHSGMLTPDQELNRTAPQLTVVIPAERLTDGTAILRVRGYLDGEPPTNIAEYLLWTRRSSP